VPTFRLLSLLLFVVLLTGCASSRVPSEPPQTLDAVNRALVDRWARIQLDDGSTIGGIESVRVGPDSTTYVDRYTREAHTLATRNVRTVSIRKRGGKAGRGALLGATPGLALAGVGIVRGSGDASFGESLVAFTQTIIGAGLALTGGLIGALIGGSTSSSDWHPVYRAPIDTYSSGVRPTTFLYNGDPLVGR